LNSPILAPSLRIWSAPIRAQVAAESNLILKPSVGEGKKRFYPALDGLRAIALLMVFCWHFIHAPLGWAGVDIFFVLSGFLITDILYDTRHASHRVRNFYVRRTLRIFPLYYAVLLLVLLSAPVFHWIWFRGCYLWPLYLGNYDRFLFVGDYQRNASLFNTLNSSLPVSPPYSLQFVHFWTLCVEEQFYLVWPLVVFLVKDRIHLRNLCAAVVILVPLLRLLCVRTLPAPLLQAHFLYMFTPLRIDALLLGGFIALCLRGPEAELLFRLARPLVLSLPAAFVLVEAGTLIFAHHPLPAGFGTPWMSIIGFTLIDLFAAAILLLALVPTSFLYRIFNLLWLRRLGQMSYGFYIFHLLFYDAYRRLAVLLAGRNARSVELLTAVIGLLGTLLLSYLSFRFFESKFLRLKGRFTVS
jgi:peptidoglycan/LPS O-acetylase OafA/YrhL